MIPQAAQQAMKEWLKQATPPEQQLDRCWIGRYRELNSQDGFWWLSCPHKLMRKSLLPENKRVVFCPSMKPFSREIRRP